LHKTSTSFFSSYHLTLLSIDLKNQINDYQTKITDLKLRLDEGANITLINAINSSMSAGNLKNLLMSKSPYLSDEVLIAYILKSSVPNGNLKDVLIFNSPLTQDVKNKLNSISLPTGIRNQINAAQTPNQSERQKAIDLIKYYQFEISILKNDIVRNYVNDSTVEIKIDTIISRVKEFEDIDIVSSVKTKEMLADLYIEKGNFSSADSIITIIEQNPSKQNIAKLKRVNKHIKENNENMFALQTDMLNKQKVDEVAADEGVEGHETAMNILQQVFNEIVEEQIDDIIIPTYHSYIPMQESQMPERIIVPSIFPNPNNGTMQLNYELWEEEAGVLAIFDVTGKLVFSYLLDNSKTNFTINESELNNGVYLYQIKVNNQIVNSDKLIIIKN